MHVIVNAAMSADGKLATPDREQIKISGPEDFDRVDALRADVDAVAVGVGTVLADDPSLTVDDPDRVAARRERGDPPQPTRVVFDSTLRTPDDARVLDDEAPTLVVASRAAPADRRETIVSDETIENDEAIGNDEAIESDGTIETAGATVLIQGDDRVDLPAAVTTLEDRGIDSMLVEGGGELLASVFEASLADRVSLFVGPLLLGGRTAPTLADGDGFDRPFPELTLDGIDRLDDGVVLHWSVVEA